MQKRARNIIAAIAIALVCAALPSCSSPIPHVDAFDQALASVMAAHAAAAQERAMVARAAMEGGAR